MNALDLLQAAVIADYPTVAQVITGTYTPSQEEVVLVLFRNGTWTAAGPFPTKDVEWNRLLPTDRIYPE